MPSSTPEMPDLTTLARAKFNRLSKSELKILNPATSGGYGPSDRNYDPGNDPAQAGSDDERTIRAELIRWLCLDQNARGLVDPRGIRVDGGRIPNQLDLSFATVLLPLTFENCFFAGGINLRYAQLEALSMEGVRTAAIGADGVKVRGNLFFRNSNAEGEVRLQHADIGGNLDCANTTFRNGLTADGLKVAGSVILRNGFRADGEVRLEAAEIGGDLLCENGTFRNAGGDALSANGIKVGGDVFLADGFSAEGQVRLYVAEIGGDLECEKGKFKNADGEALSAYRIKVGGDLFLTDCFILEGGVLLVGAQIGGDFDCSGARFAPDSVMNAEEVSVKGTFRWRKVSWKGESEREAESGSPVKPRPSGGLRLSHMTVGPMADDEDSWPSTGRLQLAGFVYARIASGPDDAKSRLEWLSRQGQGFWPQPYRQLAKVLRETGDDYGAQRVLVAMEDSRRKYGGLSWWSWIWSWIFKVTIGYGYLPLRAAWWVAAVIPLGFFLFSWGQDAGVLAQLPADGTDAPVYRPFNGFVYSLETFLPVVDLRFAKHWLPAREGSNPRNPVDLLKHLRHWPFRWLPHWNYDFGPNFREQLRWYFWFHILAGWLFATLVLNGVTHLVRKD